MHQKHLIILGIRGLPAAHGGFESFAERLAPYMVQQGWKVTVYCQGSTTGERYEDTWGGCRRIYIPVKGDGPIATIEFDIKATIDALRQCGIMLTLGYNTGFLSLYTRIRRRINIINMDGIEWRRAKYSVLQKIYLFLNERLAALSGDLLIADHPEIARHHERHARPTKIRMIPYGGERVENAEESVLNRLGVKRDKFFTVIARPEPENSILEIVRAFSSKPRNAKLVILGNYDRHHNYQSSVLDAASEDVIFPGAIYDKPTLRALRLFSLAYLHGHQVGGTNPSLVEALGAGNAVIAHDNAFNRWVAGDAGLYFDSVHTCAAHIGQLCIDLELRDSLRRAARQRWREEFTWSRVLSQYEAVLAEHSTKSASSQ